MHATNASNMCADVPLDGFVTFVTNFAHTALLILKGLRISGKVTRDDADNAGRSNQTANNLVCGQQKRARVLYIMPE